MKKIAFVILHYQTIEDTIKCVESIKKYVKDCDYEIVIVDNNSLNKSGQKLLSKYKDDINIKVIINDKNLGFSSGNNIGFRQAKKDNADFIVLMNNDTCLVNDEFIKVIKEEYENSKFAVLGPKIILKDNTICLMNGKLMTIKQFNRYLRNLKIKLFLNYLHLDKLTKFIEGKKEISDTSYVEKRRENVVLHGCCWVFSPIFISKFDGIDEKTFLYCEEELLYLKIRKNNMISVYNPKLVIYHNEFSATNTISKSNNKKLRFRYKNMIKSTKVVIKELKNNIN